MQLTNFLPTLLAFLCILLPSALAYPEAILPATTTFPPIPSSLLPAVSSAYASAISSWVRTKTAVQDISAARAYFEYINTRKDIPEIVTATDRTTSYSTWPDWYKALPTDLKAYGEQIQKEQDELRASVIKKVTGGATRPGNLGVYVSGTIAVLVAGVAMAW
ncbi:hypothetical protein E8E13_002464 [Curvularia kusanoi]|uniref:Uncharacterized protein n=1 Tax=Curvularia kusanoi TaxID=90978 RepID=A0A9P4T693_CURKU|nr:hypothetical protein E8E13_002464 [Curvularia kusanoi]